MLFIFFLISSTSPFSVLHFSFPFCIRCWNTSPDKKIPFPEISRSDQLAPNLCLAELWKRIISSHRYTFWVCVQQSTLCNLTSTPTTQKLISSCPVQGLSLALNYGRLLEVDSADHILSLLSSVNWFFPFCLDWRPLFASFLGASSMLLRVNTGELRSLSSVLFFSHSICFWEKI
jgi:hypothetical protein